MRTTKTCICDQCGQSFIRRAAEAGRCARQFCSLKCSGLGRRKYIAIEQKKAQKAAYDKQYRVANLERLTRQKAEHYQTNRDPEREREYRKARMARHVEYCRRPEYRKEDYVLDVPHVTIETGCSWAVKLHFVPDWRWGG